MEGSLQQTLMNGSKKTTPLQLRALAVALKRYEERESATVSALDLVSVALLHPRCACSSSKPERRLLKAARLARRDLERLVERGYATSDGLGTVRLTPSGLDLARDRR